VWSAAACNARRQRRGLLCHLNRAYYKHRDRLHAFIGWECRVRCCVASHQCHSCFTNTRGLEACDLQEIQVFTSSLVDAPSRHLPVITNSMKGGRTQSDSPNDSPNHFTTESLFSLALSLSLSLSLFHVLSVPLPLFLSRSLTYSCSLSLAHSLSLCLFLSHSLTLSLSLSLPPSRTLPFSHARMRSLSACTCVCVCACVRARACVCVRMCACVRVGVVYVCQFVCGWIRHSLGAWRRGCVIRRRESQVCLRARAS